jgi:hypothetical protein
MLMRIILALGLIGSPIIAAAIPAHAVGLPGAVGGPAKQNAGVVIGKPILKHH